MMEDEKNIVKFTAKIDVVKFYNEDNNYHIMQFSTNQKLPHLKAHAGQYVGILVGTCIKCIDWHSNSCNKYKFKCHLFNFWCCFVHIRN